MAYTAGREPAGESLTGSSPVGGTIFAQIAEADQRGVEATEQVGSNPTLGTI